MDLDVSPIIPDEPRVRKEPYNLALSKLIRANDHKIIGSFVKYEGSVIRIELTIQSDKDIVDTLQSMKDLEIKEPTITRDKLAKDAEDFIDILRSTRTRYMGDNALRD